MAKINLSKISPKAPKKTDKSEYKEKLKELTKEIGELSEKLYAEKRNNI